MLLMEESETERTSRNSVKQNTSQNAIFWKKQILLHTPASDSAHDFFLFFLPILHIYLLLLLETNYCR